MHDKRTASTKKQKTLAILNKKHQLCSPPHRGLHFSGLFGFDSGQKRYVSMQCIVRQHYNLDGQKLSGENNYALAA